jgi:hypothetical protein
MVETVVGMFEGHHHTSCLSVLAVAVETFGSSGATHTSSDQKNSVEAMDRKAFSYNTKVPQVGRPSLKHDLQYNNRNQANRSLNHVKYSLNHAKRSLNHAKCSLNLPAGGGGRKRGGGTGGGAA